MHARISSQKLDLAIVLVNMLTDNMIDSFTIFRLEPASRTEVLDALNKDVVNRLCHSSMMCMSAHVELLASKIHKILLHALRNFIHLMELKHG